MSENITEEELYEAIKADLPKLRIVQYEELLLADKLMCHLNKLDYGIRLWGYYRVRDNVLFLLDGMPHEVQQRVAKEHWVGNQDPYENLYKKGVLNQYKSKRKLFLWVCTLTLSLPLLIVAAISQGIQENVLKREIYLEGVKEDE